MTDGAGAAPQGTVVVDASASGSSPYAEIGEFSDLGVRALITTRAAGSFSLLGGEAVGDVTARWQSLRSELGVGGLAGRFATAAQVHRDRVLSHQSGWTGLLRTDEADGHYSERRGTALGVTVADCVPVFLVHPQGSIALVHAGWRGTAGHIVRRALDLFVAHGHALEDVRAHLGPSICGSCYEVGPEVYGQLTGRRVDRPAPVDLRAILAAQARDAGVRSVTISGWCTRCDNNLFFSHRAGDTGRQVAALVASAARD